MEHKMTKSFIATGNTIRVCDRTQMISYDDLPAATYTVKFNEQTGEFYLEVIENFTLPDKIYGTNNNSSRRILNTFQDRTGSTGVLLSGVKGAGKTLLAKQTSVSAREMGIPTIVINRDWHGDEFNSFIQSITTPTIILFDEFEKIYDYQSQRKILTLLDGVFNSRKLFLITTNTSNEVSEYMRNRPGRLFYNFKFDALEQDFIREYLEDRLDDKSKIESIIKYTTIFSFFNFDMLCAVVEEMNRYNESLTSVLEVLNIEPENRQADAYTVTATVGGKSFTLDLNYYGFHPNHFEYCLWLDDDMHKSFREDDHAAGHLRDIAKSLPNSSERHISITPDLIKGFDPANNRFEYIASANGKELCVYITRNDPMAQWKYNPDSF
jgi:hypothetical protein